MATEITAEQLLQNGLLLEQVPLELRTENLCLHALKWGLKSQDIKGTCEDRQQLCARIIKCFPDLLLVVGFVTGHLAFLT
jgi:hypothetical protein